MNNEVKIFKENWQISCSPLTSDDFGKNLCQLQNMRQ